MIRPCMASWQYLIPVRGHQVSSLSFLVMLFSWMESTYSLHTLDACVVVSKYFEYSTRIVHGLAPCAHGFLTIASSVVYR